MDVLVVLPTYNEAENIDHVLRRIRAALPAATVLVVDDGSPDGTADIAERLGKELGNIEVLRRHGKSGLGQRLPGRVPVGPRPRASTPASRWMPTSPTSPRRCPSLVGRAGRGVRAGRRVPLHPRRGHPQLGLAPPTAVPGRQHLRLDPARARRVADSTVRVPGLRGVGAAPHRPRPGPGRRVRVPDRDDLRGPSGPGPPVVEVPIRFVDRVEGESKMSAFIVVEALGLVTLVGGPAPGGSVGGGPEVGPDLMPRAVTAGRCASWSWTTSRTSPTW